MKGLNPLVEYSFDPDDYDRRDFYDDRRDERREQDMIDDMRRESALDDYLRDAMRTREQEALREVVNNPNIKVDKALMTAINDQKKVMDRNGSIRTRRSTQFDRSNILPSPGKRTRKKTKCDRNMSKALKLANAQMRKKNGKLRKGKTMADVMRRAHRLCKKM